MSARAASMRGREEKKNANISRKRTRVARRADGGGHENAIRAEWKRRKHPLSPPKPFYFGPPFSVARGAAATWDAARGMQIFWHERARACNNFMEISRPAKYSRSRGISRAGDAMRIEKPGGRRRRRRKKSFFTLFLSGTAVGDAFLSRVLVGIERGATSACLSRIHRRCRTDFFFAPFSPFIPARPRRYGP